MEIVGFRGRLFAGIEVHINLMRDDMYDLAIIGAGPGGISMAVEARYADIAADRMIIFEKGSLHSWAIRQHYAADKLVTENYKGYDVVPEGALGIKTISKDETISYLERAINEHDLRINYDETVTAIRRSEEGWFEIRSERGSYRAGNCAIAIGILEKPNKPDYRLPRSLKMRIHHDIPSEIIKDNTFLVVGGGDTAFERASYLCRIFKKVTLSYRQSKFTRMSDENAMALLELETDGRLEIHRPSNIIKVDIASGKPKVTFAEEGPEARVFDHIIYCLGGTTPEGFLKGAGIEFEGETPVIRDGYETNVPGLFLIGDLSAGMKGGSVNWAFNSSHAAIRKITDKIIEQITESGRAKS
jgi:thioredoxin reductase (NADPH)